MSNTFAQDELHKIERLAEGTWTGPLGPCGHLLSISLLLVHDPPRPVVPDPAAGSCLRREPLCGAGSAATRPGRASPGVGFLRPTCTHAPMGPGQTDDPAVFMGYILIDFNIHQIRGILITFE